MREQLSTLSSGTSPAIAGATINQFVTFSSGEIRLGVDIMAVREIRSWQPATQLAGRPSVSRGVLDIRGQVVEVLDLSVLLGGAQTPADRGSVVLVLSIEERTVGLLVDAVSDIIQVESSQIMPVPASSDPSMVEHVSGMVNHDDRLVALLDVSVLL
jgi:purine-binding chemotaxis protein CheW